jgi:hypothetical protein
LLQLSGLEISPHRVRHFQLLLLLIKLPLQEIEINGIDNKILEFSDIRDVESLLQIGIGQDLESEQSSTL